MKKYYYVQKKYCNKLPEAAGYSMYKNVLIRWQNEPEEEVIDIVDKLKDLYMEILVVQKDGDNLHFIWGTQPPENFLEGKELDLLSTSTYHIRTSIIINS